jgi:hypothetical protein
VLPDDLRLRMQAAVEAERAEARERVAEVLRHPPQRRAAPAGKQAGKLGPAAKPERRGRFERRGKAQRAVTPDAAASSGPNAIAPSVNDEAAVNSAVAEPVSPARPEFASVPTPAMAPGHPSGPVAAQPALAPAEPAPPAPPAVHEQPRPAGPEQAQPAWPYAAELQPVDTPEPHRRRRWAKTGLVVAALAVVAAGSAGAVIVMSKGGLHRAGGSSGAVVPAAQTAAVSWVVGQVNPKTVVACDQVMCAALVAHGYPPDNLRKLGSTSALQASGVVVVTPAAQHLFGSSLATAWAPAALATFGAGSSAISVRVVAPKGAGAYEKAASKDQADRKTSEAALTQVKSITISRAATADLQAGRVDGRLMEAIADAAAAQPINIVEFGNAGSGASADVPLRYADLVASNPVANMGIAAYVQSLRAGMNGGPGPRPDRTEIVRLPGGQRVLRVEFSAPSPFGVLSGP